VRRTHAADACTVEPGTDDRDADEQALKCLAASEQQLQDEVAEDQFAADECSKVHSRHD
jgi:hypothetical protein